MPSLTIFRRQANSALTASSRIITQQGIQPGQTVIQRHHILLLGLLAVLTVCSLFFSLLTGSVELSLRDVFLALAGDDSSLNSQVLREIRIPRTLAGFATGGLLAMSGVIMQVLLRNPLADPYILGISGGAAVGALSAILLGLGGLWLNNAAFFGALLSIVLVFGIANRFGQWSVTRLLLTGVVISAGWGAVINVLLTTSSSNTVQSMLFWLMGDLSQSQVGIGHFLLLFAGLATALLFSRSLNVLVRGELVAAGLGVDIERLRILLYFAASLFTASAVTVAGSVGFVGLIIPHMLRLLGARDHRILFPGAVLLGGSFLVIADSLARSVVAPQQLPVGVVTAIIGVPSFLIILRSTISK
jgi:iron complex transport system permease protein